MVRISPSAVAILVALWLFKNSYALGHYRKSSHDDLYFDASSGDSSENVSTAKVPDNPSYGRGIHHSAWSKEEKETLTSNSDENDLKKRWVESFFPDLRKFFQSIVSFLHKNDSSEKISNHQSENTENYESQAKVSSSLNIDKSKNDATLLPYKWHENVNKDLTRNIKLEGRSDGKKGNDNDWNYEAEGGDDDGQEEYDDDNDDDDDTVDDDDDDGDGDDDDNDNESDGGDSGDEKNDNDEKFDDQTQNIEKSLRSQMSNLDDSDSNTTNSTKQTILNGENYQVHPVIPLNDTGGNLDKNEFKSLTVKNEQNPSQKSELINDYINNHNQSTPEARNIQQPNNINSTDQVISDQQNNKAHILIPENENDSKLKMNESFTITNGQKPSGKSKLIESEFIDDYTKNQNQKISASESNQQSRDMNSTTQVIIPEQQNYKTQTLRTQNNNAGQLNTDLHKSLTTAEEHKPLQSFELTDVDFVNGYIKKGDRSASKTKRVQDPTNKMSTNQAISSKQNYKAQSVVSQYESEGKLIGEIDKFLTITNRQRPSQNTGLIAEEFIDDYINNRRQIAPKLENDPLKKSAVLIPKINEEQSERVLMPVPINNDTFLKENKLLDSTMHPIYRGGVKDRFLNLGQIKNEKEFFRRENDSPHTSLYKAYAEDVYSNQKPTDKKPTENTFTSAGEHVLYGQENSYAPTPIKPITFQQVHEIHLPTRTLQKQYNVNAEPKAQNYQNNENVEKTVNNDSHTSSDKQKIMDSTSLLPIEPLHPQKEHHNYTEQHGKHSEIEMTNGQQAEKTKLDSKHSTINSTMDQTAPIRNLSNDTDKPSPSLYTSNSKKLTNQSTDIPTNIPKSAENVSTPQLLILENPLNRESSNLAVSNSSEPLSEDDSDDSDESDYSDETSSLSDEDEIEYDKEPENSSNCSNAIAKNMNSTREQQTQSTTFINIHYSTEIPTTSKTETGSDETPKSKESFNTILEYIYKFSNDSFFKGLREESNVTM